MIARSVHHVSFVVSDLERSRHFYEELLGLTPIPRPDLGLPGSWYRAGEAEVHLIAAPDGVEIGQPPPKLTPLANHSAFAIDHYDEVAAFLKSKDVEVLETNAEVGQMWICDPDGNIIELISRRA